MDENIERYKISKLIKILDSYNGEGTSMISIILPPRDQVSKMASKLTDEYGAAANIKSRVNRLSVLSAIISAQQKLKLYNRIPHNGLVIYCGTITTETGKEKKINIDFEPFSPINQSIYLCGNKFHTEPLQDLLRDDKKYGFIIVDGHSCLYGLISGNNREILHKFDVDLPAKHNKGGQSARRFARLREEKRHNYLRKVSEGCINKFITDDKPNINGLFLGGLASFKNELYEMIDIRLKSIVIKIVDISYGGLQGFNEAIDKCSEELADLPLIRERKIISRFMDQISCNGFFCIGVKETILALESGVIEVLIVWEELPIIRKEIVDEEGEEKVVFEDNESYRITSQQPLVEWLVDNYTKYGAELQLVSERTPQGSQFCSGLGGIGAILRYKMDFDELMEIEDEE